MKKLIREAFWLTFIYFLVFTLSVQQAFAVTYLTGDAIRSPDRTKSYLLPGASDTLAGLAASQSFSNKTLVDPLISGSLLLGEVSSTPSTPSSGNKKIYAKNDGKVYTLSSAGVETQVGAGAAAGNLLTNPDWEAGSSGWTASGGTYSTTTTAANVGSLTTSGTWDSSAASQTLTSNSVTITSGDGKSSQNIAGSCRIKAASAATHKLQLYDGANVLSELTITSNTSTFARTSINGVAPASGTVSLRLISVASNEPAIYIDDCYLGLAEGFNLMQVSQASLVASGYFASTASCDWVRSSTTYGSYGTVAACPGPTVESNNGPGTLQTTDTDLPKFTINNLPPGRYQVFFTGTSGTSGGSTGLTHTISDGTTTSGRVGGLSITGNAGGFSLVGTFEYTSAGNRTFELQGLTQAGTAHTVYNTTTGSHQTTFQVVRYPTLSEVALRANQQVLPTVTRYTSGSGTYTVPAGVSHIRVRMVGGGGGGQGSGSASRGAGGTGGSTTFGSLTAGGGTGGSDSQSAGGGSASGGDINVAGASAAGSYTASIGGGHGANSAFGGAGSGGVAGGAGGAAQANSGSGGGGGGAGTNVGGGGAAGGYVEKIITAPSATYSYSVGAAGTAGTAGTSGLVGGAGGAGQIIIEEFYQLERAPVLVNSVTSNSTGAERIERLRVEGDCASSPCTITSQSGSWASSVSRITTGTYDVNFVAGMFSAAPTCTVAAKPNSTGTTYARVNAPDTTAVRVNTYNSVGNVLIDSGFHIICMGPR